MSTDESLRERVLAALRRVWRALRSPDTITDRAVSGGIWAALTNIADRVLQLAVVLVLARIIGPAEFGLFGIAMLTLSGAKRLSRLGIDAALIHHADDDVDAYLDTAWTMRVARGVFLAALLVALAGPIATLFSEPAVVRLLRTLAVVPLLTGLRNPGVVYLEKNLAFDRRFAYLLAGRLCYVGAAFAAAVVSPTVWALVAGVLAGNLTWLVASFVVDTYRPQLSFDRSRARELVAYGRWIFASTVLSFLSGHGDDGFVGWFLGTAALGFYRVGYRFSNAPTTEITQTVSTVVFPTYAKLQDDPAALRRGFLDTLTLVAAVTIPASVGIILVTRPFVAAVLGPDWLPMVVPMQVLAGYGLLRSLRSATNPLFRAIGRPQYEALIRLVKLLLLAAFILPATATLGLTGTALTVLGHSLLTAPLAYLLVMHSIPVTARDLVGPLVYPVVGSLTLSVAVVFVAGLIPGRPLLTFVTLVSVGVAVYAGTIALLIGRTEYRLGQVLHTVGNSVSATE